MRVRVRARVGVRVRGRVGVRVTPRARVRLRLRLGVRVRVRVSDEHHADGGHAQLLRNLPALIGRGRGRVRGFG